MKLNKCTYRNPETNKEFNWKNFIKKTLLEGEIISVESLTQEMYSFSRNEYPYAKTKTRSTLCRLRNKIEEESEGILVCRNGEYFITNEGELAVKQNSKHKRRMISGIKKQIQETKNIIKSFPEQVPVIRAYNIEVLQQALALEARNLRKTKAYKKSKTWK